MKTTIMRLHLIVIVTRSRPISDPSLGEVCDHHLTAAMLQPNRVAGLQFFANASWRT